MNWIILTGVIYLLILIFIIVWSHEKTKCLGECDISEDAGRLYFAQRAEIMELMNQEWRKRNRGETHIARLAGGKS